MAKKKKKTVSAKANDAVPQPEPRIGHIVGTWAFILGFVIAIITAFADYLPLLQQNAGNLQFLLIMAGVIVGFLNVRNSEARNFMLAGIALVLISWLGIQTVSTIEIYHSFLVSLQTLFVPATIIVALRSLFHISHK